MPLMFIFQGQLCAHCADMACESDRRTRKLKGQINFMLHAHSQIEFLIGGEALLSGEKPAAPVAKAFQQEVVTLMDFRRSASGTKKNLKRSEVLSSENLFTQMPALSKVIKKSII